MKFLYLTSLAVLAALSINTGHAEQICNSNLAETAPSSRFQITEDEALDTKTGLIWKRCMVGQTWDNEAQKCSIFISSVNWKEALESATDGWRLPNIKELGSIVEHSCANPSLNMDVFPGPSAYVAPRLWSSTPALWGFSRITHDGAWTMHFQDGTSIGTFKKNRNFFALLVRDAPDVTVVTQIAN